MRQNANKTYTQTVTWNTKDLAVGATLEGDYVDKETFTNNFGERTKYVIKADDGTEYGVYGSAVLNRLFANVPVGSRVWVSYQGEATSKTGRTVKMYTVDFDPEYNA